MTEKIELYNCWRWICPKCSHVNYHGGHDPKLSEEEVKELMDQMSETLGFDVSADDGAFVMIPEIVFCQKCEERYEVQD